MFTKFYVIGISIISLVACSQDNSTTEFRKAKEPVKVTTPDLQVNDIPTIGSDRKAWFGETHVHTELSVDAGIYNVTASPDDAYRYAKGEAIEHTSGTKIQSSKPLDFMAITDHAEYLGVIKAIQHPDAELSGRAFAQDLISSDRNLVEAAFKKIGMSFTTGDAIEELRVKEIEQDSWLKTIDAAEWHNDPGNFTTFIAFEWSSHRNSNNLHRNVIFRGNRHSVAEVPFSVFDSSHPEDLWNYLDNLRDLGIEVLAIPHNSNLSNGFMFPVEFDSKGNTIDIDYIKARRRNEPLVEISQIKGTSETHPSLAPNDEWSNFELLEEIISHTVKAGEAQKGVVHGSYVREALKDGLKLEAKFGGNPHKFGILASTDSHNASVPNEEDNYTGKFGIADDTPEHRRTGFTAGMNVRKWSASGLAGVWAEENTRSSLYDALVRKETFGTSGPRIKVRLFGGWKFSEDTMDKPDWIDVGYSVGVPMGRDLISEPESDAPQFLVWAKKDVDEAPLQRLQIIKGWLQDGKKFERVYDVACANNEKPDSITHRCPDNGANVDIKTCQTNDSSGNVELSTVWTDPDFEKRENAFYYVRALQNPTCRWSTWDAIRMNLPFLEDVPPTIQERAWSSPIWYSPR